MFGDTLNFLSEKTEEELLVILQGFLLMCSDADSFDQLAEKLDISDDWLVKLREDVFKYVENI